MAGQLKKRHRTDTVREPMRTGTNKKHFYKKKRILYKKVSICQMLQRKYYVLFNIVFVKCYIPQIKKNFV